MRRLEVRTTVRPALYCSLALAIALALPIPTLAARLDDEQTTTAVLRVLELTNTEREQAGLGPLALSPELSGAAQDYSQVLASGDCFAHTCGPLPKFRDRVTQAGYLGWTAIGENIAAGYLTPEAVVAGWMASSGHRANILSPRYSEIGIGVVSSGGRFGMYWTQDFGSRGVMPVASSD